MDIYPKTVNYVDKAFGGKSKPHFERTVYWIERFWPQCAAAHRVAAYSHDIERANRDSTKPVPDSYLDPTFLHEHQEQGAEIMRGFLLSEGQETSFVDTVFHLISKHEEGGDDEQNALMDADSVSFFETNAEMFVQNKAPIEGHRKVKEKLDWMYNRISSEYAKQAAKTDYERWAVELEKQIT